MEALAPGLRFVLLFRFHAVLRHGRFTPAGITADRRVLDVGRVPVARRLADDGLTAEVPGAATGEQKRDRSRSEEGFQWEDKFHGVERVAGEERAFIARALDTRNFREGPLTNVTMLLMTWREESECGRSPARWRGDDAPFA